MTLREEIITTLETIFISDKEPSNKNEVKASIILGLIEKRIDSVRLPKIKMGTYTQHDLEYLASCIMEDVKREMLK